MNTPCPNYEPLIAEALFGELSPEERRRLDRHVATCEACAEELHSMRATLQLTAERERSAPPPSFWHGYWPRLVRRMEREAAGPASITARLTAWWRRVTAVPPAMRWALQGAVAVVLVLGGFWLGRQQTAPAADDALFSAEEPPATLADLMPASASTRTEQASAPMFAGIEDITYDLRDGTVAVRYNAVSDIIVRGAADDPAIQHLLQTAMLNEQDPAARLNALQAVEKTRPDANDGLVQALTYLVQTEQDAGMRLRAMRALRALQQETGSTLPPGTRDVLINMLLTAPDAALRIEALQALMNSASASSAAAPDYLYAIQNDSNSYVRYQAQQALQRARPSSSSDPLNQ